MKFRFKTTFHPRRLPAFSAAILAVCPALCAVLLDFHFTRAIQWMPRVEIMSPAWAADNDLFAVGPEQIKADLEAYFQKATSDIAADDFRAAHQELSLINFRIDKYKKSLSNDDRRAIKFRVASLDAGMKQKVDSLIKVNIAIVQKQGRKAGYEFRQFLSVQAGLSETELAPVDQAIMESTNEGEETTPVSGLSPPPSPPAAAPTPSQEIQPSPKQTPKPQPQQNVAQQHAEALAPAPLRKVEVPAEAVARLPQPVHTPDTIRHAAEPLPQPAAPEPESPAVRPKPEKQQPDADEERARLTAASSAAKVRTLLDEGNTDEAMTVFHIYQKNLQRFLAPPAYESLESGVETSFSQKQTGRTQASQLAQAIERLLDQDRVPDAMSELTKSRDELQRFMDKQELRDLEKRVGQAYVEYQRRQGWANAAVDDIRRLIAEKKIEEAYSLFEKKQADLVRYCFRDTFDAIHKQVAATYETVKDRKKLSLTCRRDIMSLIKAGKELDASERFSESRAMLSESLDTAAFAALQAEVDRANTGFAARQAGAKSIAGRIDSLVGAGRPKEAHDLFENAKDRLRRDMADDKRFFDLRERVSRSYGEMRNQQRQAIAISDKIYRFVDGRQGRKADLLFKENAPSLKLYLETNAFVRLQASADIARMEYDKKVASTTTAMSEVAGLLDQTKVEQAYAVFRKAEDDIDFYCTDETAAGALAKRVKAAYAEYKERKTWAASEVHHMRELIDKRRGNEAYSLFRQECAQLAHYCDGKSLARLDTSATAANRRFNAAKASAEQNATAIRGMIVQKRVDDAYAAFDTLEPNLKFYLEQPEFSALKTIVEKFNSDLKDNRREARAVVDAINRLIEKDRGDTAYVLLSNNDGVLKAYLPARVYASLRSRVSRAKSEWEDNTAAAQALADRLQMRAQKEDGVISAHDEFEEKRGFLEQYLVNWKSSRLAAAIGAPYDAFMDKRKQARATGSAIRRLIRENQGVEAAAEFRNVERNLGRYLPRDEYADLSAKVSQAYQATLQGRKEAREKIAKIHGLLSMDKAAEAYRVFTDAQQTLETYLSSAEFDRVRNEATSAYDDLEKKAGQVREYAKKLRQLVAKNKLWDAYKGFRMNHASLAEFLDAQTYADLESTVVGAYEKAKAKARRART
jgi:hypothetical protein